MKLYRVTALTALACLAGLSLAACSGGISTVAQSPETSAPPASVSAGTSAPASAPAAASTASTGVSVSGAPAAGTSSTITVGGGIGAFPIPPGASVIENSLDNGKPSIAFTGVTASEVTTFYTASLPSYGYTITENDAASGTSVTGTTIKFTGHGYNGDIGAMSGTGSLDGVSLGTTTSGGVTGITFTLA
jgi:hypothetical protein